MKIFDQLLEEDIEIYEGRHDDLIYQAPALYRLLVRLLDDPLLPPRLRPLVIAGIAYFIGDVVWGAGWVPEKLSEHTFAWVPAW